MSIKREEGREGMDERKGKSVFSFLGLTFGDVIKAAFVAAGVLIFAVKADQRLLVIEQNQKVFLEVTAFLKEYVSNSDNYHSALTGFSFRMGRPEIPAAGGTAQRMRDIINGVGSQ